MEGKLLSLYEKYLSQCKLYIVVGSSKAAGANVPFMRSEKTSNDYAYSFPPQRCVVIREGKIEMLHPEHRNTRSQDLEPYYHDCGQFYFYDTEELIKNKGNIIENVIPMVLSELEVQDIDNESDWALAEIRYKTMASRKITNYTFVFKLQFFGFFYGV